MKNIENLAIYMVVEFIAVILNKQSRGAISSKVDKMKTHLLDKIKALLIVLKFYSGPINIFRSIFLNNYHKKP